MSDAPPHLPADSHLDTAIILALIFLLAMVLMILAFVTIPEKNEVLFGALASGVVGSSIATFIGFKWGSSASSKVKDATIAAMVPKDGAP